MEENQPNDILPDNTALAIGSPVRIVNLVAAPRYNNKKGTIRSFQVEAGRYDVELASKKILAVKPEKLVLLCCKCHQREAKKKQACPRCGFNYCSPTCRNADWKNTHKAECIPTDLPEAPEPVLDSDTGDEIFEASRKYLEMACEAGNDGRFAEEVRLLEALIKKDDKQPAAYFNLFQRYSRDLAEKDYDKAFAYLHRAMFLMAGDLGDIALVPPSDPSSVEQLPMHPQSLDAARFQMFRSGTEFIAKHRVAGRYGSELQPDADVLEWLFQMANAVDASVISYLDRSVLCHELGNIYRKMENISRSIYFLQLAHELATAESSENYRALRLAVEVMMVDALKTTDPSAQQVRMEQVVDEARRVKGLMAMDRHEETYKADILLAMMLNNQNSICRDEISAEKQQEIVSEMYYLAADGKNAAMDKGDDHEATRAERLLSTITILPLS